MAYRDATSNDAQAACCPFLLRSRSVACAVPLPLSPPNGGGDSEVSGFPNPWSESYGRWEQEEYRKREGDEPTARRNSDKPCKRKRNAHHTTTTYMISGALVPTARGVSRSAPATATAAANANANGARLVCPDYWKSGGKKGGWVRRA